MAGLPTSQRDQGMLAVGIFAVLGAVAYWNFVFTPKGEKLEATRTHIEKLDASNQRAKAIMARGSTEKLREEAALLKANLDLMRTLIPAVNEVPALLDQILGVARRTGLEFSNFQPNATIQGETFDTYRFRISLQGTYHELGELLASIGSLRRIIVPTNVSLVPSTVRMPTPEKPEERILTAIFDIQTYVSRATPAEEDK